MGITAYLKANVEFEDFAEQITGKNIHIRDRGR